MVRATCAAAALISIIVLFGCGGEDTTTTVTTGASESSEPAEPTLTDLRHAIAAGDHPAYFNVGAFECVDPRQTTLVSEAVACMGELRRWYAERRSAVGSVAKFCTPFYRYICIPGEGGADLDCPAILREYSNGNTVVVSKYADPLNLDENRDGVGCEPYP